MIAALDALRRRASAAKDEVRKARDYFVTKAERMRYPLCAERAWPLGCEGVHATRLSQHGQWADLWKSKPLGRRPPVASLRRMEAQTT